MRPVPPAGHPLDRPIWNALHSLQAGFATGGARAVRFVPEIHLFGAAADDSPESLAALVRLFGVGETFGTVEGQEMPVPPGAELQRRGVLTQMVAETPVLSVPEVKYEPLGEADAAEMLALATLTEPGPFLLGTHRLGRFVGIRHEGQLVAMAGERLHLPGYREVSGVCTHPHFRGRGHAGALMRIVMARIVADGETPFLHSYADNAGAIALYETLGFRHRAEMVFMVLERSL